MARILAFLVLFMSFHVGRSQSAASPFTPAEGKLRSDFESHFTSVYEIHRWEIYEDTVEAWRHWDIVENYTLGPDRGRIAMIKDLQSLHPYFRDKILELIRICKTKGIELALVETYRTPTKQNEYKMKGKKYTRAGPGKSKHQYGLAVDVVPVMNEKAQWKNVALWRKVGTVGEKLGMTWGGRWRRLYDPGHFEWTGGLGVHSLSQGIFPTLPKSANYPCLDEDLKELQRHWKAWQLEQSEVARGEASKTSVKTESKPVSNEGSD